MAHHLTTNMHGQVEMAYANGIPWHGLGTQVEGLMTSKEALEKAHLEWMVTKQLVYQKMLDGSFRPIPSKYATVRSDNEFTNDLYKKYLDSKNIKQVLSNPDLPQSQAQVERMNSNVKRIISKMLLYNNKFDWTKNLRNIEEAINSTINQSTKKTPNEIEKLFDEKDEEALQEIYNIQKGIKGKQNRLAKQIVNVGDFVRIFEPNDKFKTIEIDKEDYYSGTDFRDEQSVIDSYYIKLLEQQNIKKENNESKIIRKSIRKR